LRPLQYTEIVLHQIMNLSPLMPHYFSLLFSYSVQLLSDEEIVEMEKMIGKVEMLVNGSERSIKINDDGDVILVVKPKGQYTLYDIEMAQESNSDYYAFFEREDGMRITKFDVERELDKIRKWIFLKVKERAYNMRFSRM
jgi:hypothetical protein